MRNPLSRKKNEPDKDEEFARAGTLTDAGRPTYSGGPDSDMLNSIGRTIYSIFDPMVSWTFFGDAETGRKGDSDLQVMYPAFSQLNRTTNINEKDKRIALLEIEGLLMVTEMSMDEAKFNSDGWRKLEALKAYGRFMVNDSLNGFKMKAMVEQIKQIVTRLEKPK